MNTNIFIPSKINVGFQNRDGTYTGKLAYVIYFDEKGKLRKEASWQSWRDKNIPNQIFDNTPTEGFVLNKKVGGYSSGWNYRQTYTRVYDPRGFEFEISVPNLLWILENCDCTRGKGLEGQFVYGWDKTDLVLVPVDSPDYKEIQDKNKVVHDNLFIKAKDLKIGAVYETLDGKQFVYLGKYDAFKKEYNRYYTRYYWDGVESRWTELLDETWHKDIIFGDKNTRCKYVCKGKEFWFLHLGNKECCPFSDYIVHFKSVTRKFSKMLADHYDNYDDYYDKMQCNAEFSPVDYSKSKIIPVPFDDFKNAFINKETEYRNSGRSSYLQFFTIIDGQMMDDSIWYSYSDKQWVYTGKHMSWGKKKIVTLDTIKEVYDLILPVYGEQYLENGKLNLRRGYLGSEK